MGGKRGEARKGAFFIGFLEGKRREQEEEGLVDAGVLVVVDSIDSFPCFSLESIAATKAAAQLIRGFACFHTATSIDDPSTGPVVLRGPYLRNRVDFYF